MTTLAPSPFAAAFRGRCPNCGKGRLFKTFLGFAPRCEACGVSFAAADVGDGAAVFVMFIVGAVVVPLAFILQFAFAWTTLAILFTTFTVAIALSLALLRPAKALLFALQFRHKAAEGRLKEP
jgi:uncharacterized protein (DUF983 family)